MIEIIDIGYSSMKDNPLLPFVTALNCEEVKDNSYSSKNYSYKVLLFSSISNKKQKTQFFSKKGVNKMCLKNETKLNKSKKDGNEVMLRSEEKKKEIKKANKLSYKLTNRLQVVDRNNVELANRLDKVGDEYKDSVSNEENPYTEDLLLDNILQIEKVDVNN